MFERSEISYFGEAAKEREGEVEICWFYWDETDDDKWLFTSHVSYSLFPSFHFYSVANRQDGDEKKNTIFVSFV